MANVSVFNMEGKEVGTIKILNGHLYAAHMSRHSLPLEYTAGGGAGTIGTLVTMELGTVLHRASVAGRLCGQEGTDRE